MGHPGAPQGRDNESDADIAHSMQVTGGEQIAPDAGADGLPGIED